jgi:cytochrome P450
VGDSPAASGAATGVSSHLTVDFGDPIFLAGDRREIYRRLRDESPAFLVGPAGQQTWIVSRYADVQKVLLDPAGRMHPAGIDAPPWMPEGPARVRLRANLVQTDRPVHTRLRGVLGPLFTVRQSAHMRDIAAATVARELDSVAAKSGHFDVVQDLAVGVPKGVLGFLIGMPDEDWDLVIQNQTDFLMIFSPFPLTPDQQRRLDEVSQFYLDYFDGLLGRVQTPTKLVASLLKSEEAGDLTHDEVLSVMHTVLDAGFDAVRTSIADAVEVFAKTPAIFDQVRQDHGLVEGLTEELLRSPTPVHFNTRILAQDYEVSDGTVIPAGSRVLALIGAANLDERVFPDPDTVDAGRANAKRHLTFGNGLHRCLGAPLARIQIQETVRGLASRFEGITLDAEPGPRQASLLLPSLTSLHVHAH